MSRSFLVRVLALCLASCVALSLSVAGCKKKGGSSASADPAVTVEVRDASEGLLLTWIDGKGDFHTEMRPVDVPLEGRDAVKVVDPSREDGTHADKIFVADLRVAGAAGLYPVRTMTRPEFDQIAVARREKNGPTLANAAPPASDAPPTIPLQQPGSPLTQVDPKSDGRPLVIIYGADWCSACHDAAAYLRRKGVAFIEKNVETDQGAAQEMQHKLAKNGLRGGSIPVLDVKGKIMVGFNPRSVDEALGRAI
jgi:glutaredoxin